MNNQIRIINENNYQIIIQNNWIKIISVKYSKIIIITNRLNDISLTFKQPNNKSNNNNAI